jgi:hypothetical protein
VQGRDQGSARAAAGSGSGRTPGGQGGNRLEEVATGEAIDPAEVLVDYGDHAWECIVLPVGRAIGIRRVHRETGLALSQVADRLNGRALPHASTKTLLTNTVTRWVATEIRPSD